MADLSGLVPVPGETTPDEEPLFEGYLREDEERWAPEAPKSHTRTEFERDRARLIHSSALRRLGAKTQIQMAGTDDFARTRLTHTLEVAQIGRQIGELLGCDPNVVDAACLAHDIGHPPFGHNGERALAAIAQDIGGFEGNAQTLRLLTRLEPKIVIDDGRSVGLNLTRASLDACIKYPWTYAQAAQHPKGERSTKFGVYPDDMDVFRWLKKNAPENRTPMECQVMDLADDIAYSVHDVEDAIEAGSFNPIALEDPRLVEGIVVKARQWYGQQWDSDSLEAAFGRIRAQKLLPARFTGTRASLAALKTATSNLIGRFALSVEQATREQYGDRPLTRYEANVVVPEETEYEIVALKGISVYFVMAPNEQLPFHEEQLRIVSDLVDVMMADSPRPSAALETQFLDDWYRASDDSERLRVAIDQVASLTDGSALALHSLLC